MNKGQELYNQLKEQKQEGCRYLSCADTAKLVRESLKERFPKQKFSVTSSVYSGGASINVSWENGVGVKEVEEVIKKFEGSGFDGMIDLKYSKRHYLTPNGKIVFASCEGTENSMGVIPSSENEKVPEGAILVHLCADYVFARRDLSDDIYIKVAKRIAELNGMGFIGMEAKPKDNYFGDYCQTWYSVVNIFVHDKDLSNFKDVEHVEDKDAGRWEEFYRIVEA